MPLITNPNFQQPDDFYAALLASHEGLSLPDSAALNARLILILANHVGEQAALETALTMARQTEPA